MTRDELLRILLESDPIQGTAGVPVLTEEQFKFNNDSGIPGVEALKKLVFKKMDDAGLAPVTILKDVNVVIEDQAKALEP